MEDFKIEKQTERIEEQNKVISELENKINIMAKDFERSYKDFLMQVDKINNEITKQKRFLEILKEQKKLMVQVAVLQNKLN